MSTEIVFAELKKYETNLARLLTTYELAHKNYIDSVRQNNTATSKSYLSQLNDINLDILLLMAEISQNIEKINNDEKYGKYKTDIAKKTSDMKALYNKMQVDENTIKGLMRDLNDLDGKNQTINLQHKTNSYYNMLCLVIIGIIIYIFIRLSISSESIPYETPILCLAIFLFIMFYWNELVNFNTYAKVKLGSITTSSYYNM